MKKIYFTCDWGESSTELLARYSRQTLNGSGKWNNIIGINNINEADYIVVMDAPAHDVKITDWSKVIYFQREPVKKYWLNHEFPKELFFDGTYKNFHNVVIWWINLPFEKIVELPYKTKIKKLSTVTSGASTLESHRYRLKFLSTITNHLTDIDVYGRGTAQYVPSKFYKGELKYNGNCKLFGHYDYGSSIVLENTVLKNSWTEKPSDCYLSWAKPIYWGDPILEKYFPKESFFRLNENLDLVDVKELEEEINKPINIEALKESRNLILYKYQIWPALESIINGKNIF